MSAALRKALFWLLMLLLPLQGFAAVVVQPVHGTAHGIARMTAQMRMADVAPTPGMHAVRDTRSMGDCGGFMPGCEHAGGSMLFKCSLSAVCGFVAGPAPHAHEFLQPATSLPPLPVCTLPSVAFCTGAPDRPPRSLA